MDLAAIGNFIASQGNAIGTFVFYVALSISAAVGMHAMVLMNKAGDQRGQPVPPSAIFTSWTVSGLLASLASVVDTMNASVFGERSTFFRSVTLPTPEATALLQAALVWIALIGLVATVRSLMTFRAAGQPGAPAGLVKKAIIMLLAGAMLLNPVTVACIATSTFQFPVSDSICSAIQ